MARPLLRSSAPPLPALGGMRRGVAAVAAATRPIEERRGLGLTILFALWFIVLFEPHWYLAAKGPDVVLKVTPLLFACLLLTLALGMPTNESWQRRWSWYAPLLLYLLVASVTIPFADNVGYARNAVQGLLLWWAVIVATGAIVDSTRRIEFLVVLYGLQFLWWAAWGAKVGLVFWHHSLSNYDGFGAFNVGGTAICYFLALATSDKKLKWLMYATAALCAMGVVASFARGAFLAMLIVFFCVWARSPHKGRTLLAGVGAAGIIALAASFLFEEGFFLNEIMSAFHEGTDEGTGHERWMLWKAGYRVFTTHPLFGTGLENWGVVASQLFAPGELPGEYANPGRLYDMSLHNVYVTVLAETGILGSIAFIWILVDFFRRNKAMRKEAALKQWEAMGGKLKLRPLSLGLEASMFAFMVNAAVYAMMSLHWFWTMLALNFVMHRVATRGMGAANTGRRGGAAVSR